MSEYFRVFHGACKERLAPAYCDWRPVVREVADKFLTYGVLDHGFESVRCDACHDPQEAAHMVSEPALASHG